MPHLVLFGPGYTGGHVAAALAAEGWQVTPVGRQAEPHAVVAALARATHVLSTVPPQDGADAVLATYGALLSGVPWLGYLSSTGVYGDTQGAWVDESAPLSGRRGGRIEADRAWLALGARVLRLPGIYGPGRSVLDRLTDGRAHRVDLRDQIFSRIHVADIVGGLRCAMAEGPAGAYNLADDLPASQNAVIEEACRLTGAPLPPLIAPHDPALSPMARAFYRENRRVANAKARRLLGWRPLYPHYRAGLRALIATNSPPSVSATPAAAPTVQR